MKYPFCVILSLTSAALIANVSAQARVEPAGMKIVWNSLKDEFNGFKTYNEDAGAYFSLAVHGGGKNIISFDDRKSKISVSSGGQALKANYSGFERISKNGKTMKIEVKVAELPKVAADTFELKGGLDVVMASKSETKSSKVIPLKVGQKITLTEGFTFEINKTAKPSWGDFAYEVELQWKRDIPELAAVRFFDQDGNEIESKTAGSSSFGGFGKKTVNKTYQLKKKVDQVKIEMDLWVDAEKVTIPLDFNIGLGGTK